MNKLAVTSYRGSRHAPATVRAVVSGTWNAALVPFAREFTDLIDGIIKIQILPAFFSKAGLVLSIVAFAFVFNAVSDTAEQLEQKLMALVPAPVVAN
jgi:hypothetical protein